MNHRLTATTAGAVLLASTSLFAVLRGGGWLVAGAGAAATVAVAGTLTRLSALYAAIAATVLAVLASFPLLDDRSWHWKLVGLAIVAVTAASITRLKALAVFAGAVTYLGGLLIYLTMVFADPQSLAGIVPTASSMHHLQRVADEGWRLRAFAPPVPANRGIELLAAAGIGLMAVAADVLAVRLRSPAIAGLPLLVLFSVPITTSAKPGGLGATVTFCLGVTGYLAMLAADGRDRLRIWGRLVTVWHGVEPDEQGMGPDTRAFAASGRRIGLAAVSVAVVVPLLIPLRVHGLFGSHAAVGRGPDVELPAPLDLMKSQLFLTGASHQTVLTYKTSNPQPATQYLPMFVLNLTYSGTQQDFSVVQPGTSPSSYTFTSHGSLPAPQGLVPGTPVTIVRTQITMSKSVTGYSSPLNFLPLPYAPSAVSAAGSWQADDATLMIYSGSAKLAGLSYEVTSAEANPSAHALNAAQTPLPSDVGQYEGYNGNDKTRLLTIARQITKNAHTSDQKAAALVNWFTRTGGFRYSLHPQWLEKSQGVLDTSTALVDFLTTDKIGYCQQFAYAMAVLSRLVGIPARLAVGYTAGTPEGNGTWKVTEADAHAWPELYFQNVGWLRFEPTPGGSGGQGTATQPAYATLPGSSGGTQAPGSPGSKPATGGGKLPGGSRNHIGIHDPGTTSVGGTLTPHHSDDGTLILIALAILLGLAVITPATARPLTRHRRWRRAAGDAGLAHAAWRELRDDMDDYGLACRASESPRALARRVGNAEGLGDYARQALNRVARAEERARYAAAPEPASGLRADVTEVRRALSRNASRAARWRALLLPPSTLEPVRNGLQHSLDVFGWMDAAGQRVRHSSRGALSRHEA